MNLQFEVINSPFDVRDYHINAASEFPEAYKCPLTMDIKNQGSKPTCVAHALSSLVEYHYKRQMKTSEPFSTEFIYGYREDGYYVGSGMVIRNGLNTLLKYGDPFQLDCPGNSDLDAAKKKIDEDLEYYQGLAYPHRISSYYRCNNENEIKTALMEHGPVVISMNTYNGAKLKDDIYTYDANADYGRHCVLVIGWDERGWLIQNSWGKTYGGDGCFILPFDFKINEAWGITDDIQDSETTITKPSKFTRFIAAAYNAIVNFFRNLFNQN